MAKKINIKRGNAGMGKFILRTVAVVAVGAALFFLAAPILNGISGFTAMAAGWVEGLATQAAATWKIFAGWVIALAVLLALSVGVISLSGKIFGKLKRNKEVIVEDDEL